MINLKAFENSARSADTEVAEFDIVDAVLTLDSVLEETGELIASANTVADVQAAVSGHEIGSAFLAYAGESIGQLAPAFVEGNSDEAVEQMEEGLKEFGKSVMKLIRKIMEAIGNFFKKILPFLRSSGEKIDLLTTKLGKADKLEWKKDDGTIKTYADVTKAVAAVEKLCDVLEDVLEKVSDGKLEAPTDFAHWDVMVAASKGEGDYSEETVKEITKSTEVAKKEVQPDTVIESRDWKALDSLNKKLGKLVPKIEKFVKKKVDSLEYDKEKFDVSPAEAIQKLAKYSRSFVGFLGTYLNDTLKALKQIKAVTNK